MSGLIGSIPEDFEQELQAQYEKEQKEIMHKTRNSFDKNMINDNNNNNNNHSNFDLIKKIGQENEKIVMNGCLERKTNQKVLGKRLWEKRYFTLSTHYLSIFQTEKAIYPECYFTIFFVLFIFFLFFYLCYFLHNKNKTRKKKSGDQIIEYYNRKYE